jgi:hypothetical protein
VNYIHRRNETLNNFGTLNLASASKAIGAVFVHISTDYVFQVFRASHGMKLIYGHRSAFMGLQKRLVTFPF